MSEGSRILFSPGISLQAFSPRNQSAGYFIFPEITHNLFKSQIVGGQNLLNISSVDRPWFANHFQNLLKQQETKLSKEERNSFLRSSTGRVRTDVRTYGNVNTQFSRMDSLINFLRYGALLNRPSQYKPPGEEISRYLELIRLSLRQIAE